MAVFVIVVHLSKHRLRARTHPDLAIIGFELFAIVSHKSARSTVTAAGMS